ncbi:MAG: hypothetical protein WD737_07570 [Gemmatimonadota bacterium]
MARYEREFMGIPAEFTEARGMDPNHSGHYRGMRMGSGQGRAAYGAHRLVHERDLGTEGGFAGLHGRSDDARARPFDPRWNDHGGVGDPSRRGRLLHDFNANSPMYARPSPRPRYGRELERRERFLLERAWLPSRQYRPGYSNRGMTEGGYSEGWARGPMRGAR